MYKIVDWLVLTIPAAVCIWIWHVVYGDVWEIGVLGATRVPKIEFSLETDSILAVMAIL